MTLLKVWFRERWQRSKMHFELPGRKERGVTLRHHKRGQKTTSNFPQGLLHQTGVEYQSEDEPNFHPRNLHSKPWNKHRLNNLSFENGPQSFPRLCTFPFVRLKPGPSPAPPHPLTTKKILNDKLILHSATVAGRWLILPFPGGKVGVWRGRGAVKRHCRRFCNCRWTENRSGKGRGKTKFREWCELQLHL